MKRRDNLGDLGVDLREIRRYIVNWTHLAQDRGKWRAFVNTVMNLHVPEMVGNFLTSLGTMSFSKWTLLHGVGVLVYTSGIQPFYPRTPKDTFPLNFVPPKLLVHNSSYT
jgi:hypothetical protein